MLTLVYIVVANLASTVVSLSLAVLLGARRLAGLVDRLVHVSIGLLLTTALVHLLPEALAAGVAPTTLGWTVLAGILCMFVLEKLTLIRHAHPHEDAQHFHGSGARQTGRGAYPILVGDALHNCADGVAIAAAFLVQPRAGVLTALAVLAHEIPHEIGDFMILLRAGWSRRRAGSSLALAGSAAVLGGIAGYFLLAAVQALLPYALALAAASFIYIALSDLLPDLMRRASWRDSAPEVAYVFLGVVLAVLASQFTANR